VREVTGRDVWANPSAVGREDARQMASFLEERAALPDQQQVNRALIDLLDPRPGERIVEAGSGTGVLCRLAAERVLPGGWVTGLDLSPEMTAAAERLIPPGLPVAFVIAAADAIPCPAGRFDAALAARLLLHLPEPLPVLAELARVTRRGGRVVVMDWDFETLAVDHPDRALTRRIVAWRTDHHSGNNWSGRQLRRLMLDAGFGNVQVTPVTTTVTQEATSLGQSLFRAADVACDGGAISPAEKTAWTGALRRSGADGRFLASITYFVVRGEVN
jgi:ubiquinone/menaquinone biosynthesis C-methylase UbiE